MVIIEKDQTSLGWLNRELICGRLKTAVDILIPPILPGENNFSPNLLGFGQNLQQIETDE